MGNRAGLIIGILIFFVIIIVVILIFLQFQNAKKNADAANQSANQAAQCGSSLYQSSTPIVCDFATGKEVRTKRATANANCPSSQEFANSSCDCGNICKATKTCVGSTSTTVYTVDTGKPCNAACSAAPVIVQDDPTCGVLGCDVNCTTQFGICSPSEPGKQLIDVVNKVGVPNAICPTVCKVTSINNPNCIGTGCVNTCNNPAGEIGAHDPNTGALICLDKSILGIAGNCPSNTIESIQGQQQIKVKLTTVAKGRLNPPQFLARAYNDQAGSFLNRTVIFAPETQSADNVWIMSRDPNNFRNVISLVSDPDWILAHNAAGNGFFGLNSFFNFQNARYDTFQISSEGSVIFFNGFVYTASSLSTSNLVFIHPSNSIPSTVTTADITWYSIVVP